MRLGSFLVVGLVLVGFAPAPVAAQALNAAWFCYSSPDYSKPDQSPVYVSSVWEKREDQEVISIEFKKVLATKYGYKGSVTCSGASSSANPDALAIQEKAKALKIAAWQKTGMKIVDTGWSTAQPKTGPPTVNWGVCHAMIVAAGGQPNQGPFDTYVSAPFDVGEATVQAVEAGFEKFLRTKYSVTTTDLHPQCLPMADEAQAVAAIKQWTTRGNVQGKTIETAWKFSK